MATQVYQPAPKSKDEERAIIGAIGTIGGTLASGGNPAVGGAVGGQVAGAMAPKDSPAVGGVQSTAVDRRQQQLQDAQKLDEAYSVASQDPQMKKQYGPMLLNARDRAMYGA